MNARLSLALWKQLRSSRARKPFFMKDMLCVTMFKLPLSLITNDLQQLKPGLTPYFHKKHAYSCHRLVQIVMYITCPHSHQS